MLIITTVSALGGKWGSKNHAADIIRKARHLAASRRTREVFRKQVRLIIKGLDFTAVKPNRRPRGKGLAETGAFCQYLLNIYVPGIVSKRDG